MTDSRNQPSLSTSAAGPYRGRPSISTTNNSTGHCFKLLNSVLSPHTPHYVKGEKITATVILGRNNIAMPHPEGTQCCCLPLSNHTLKASVRVGLTTKQCWFKWTEMLTLCWGHWLTSQLAFQSRFTAANISKVCWNNISKNSQYYSIKPFGMLVSGAKC